MTTLYQATYQSPLGQIVLSANQEAVVSIEFSEEFTPTSDQTPELPVCLQQGLQQIKEYFAGIRLSFDFPVQAAGTSFQQQVWQLLTAIPFGQTVSYNSLALKLNNPGAIRAIGAANGKNKLAIVWPCHRVIGSNGQLVGYASGIWRKQWLLHHERTIAGTQQLTLFSADV